MTEEAAPAPPKSRPGLRALWICLVGFAGLLLILLGVFLYYWIPTGKIIERERVRTREEIAALRAQRVTRPTFFEPAEEGNGWDEFSKGLAPFDLLDETQESTFPSLRVDEEDPAPEAEVVARAVAKVEPHFDTLRSSLRKAWVEPGYPFEEGVSMKLPLVALSIKATRILGDRARTGGPTDLPRPWGARQSAGAASPSGRGASSSAPESWDLPPTPDRGRAARAPTDRRGPARSSCGRPGFREPPASCGCSSIRPARFRSPDGRARW